MRNAYSRSSGFSFLEAATVIVIVAIIAALMVPLFAAGLAGVNAFGSPVDYL